MMYCYKQMLLCIYVLKLGARKKLQGRMCIYNQTQQITIRPVYCTCIMVHAIMTCNNKFQQSECKKPLLTCIKNSFIGHFQQQPYLWIHSICLFWSDTKKRSIKLCYILQLAKSLWCVKQTWNTNETSSQQATAENISELKYQQIMFEMQA